MLLPYIHLGDDEGGSLCVHGSRRDTGPDGLGLGGWRGERKVDGEGDRQGRGVSQGGSSVNGAGIFRGVDVWAQEPRVWEDTCTAY
jgi:hypothetical protein